MRRFGTAVAFVGQQRGQHAGAFLVSLLVSAASAHAFVCLKTDAGSCLHWTQGQATLQSFLGAPGTLLLNGTVSWDQNAIDAADDWNAVGAAFHFDVAIGGPLYEPCGSGVGHACPNTGPAGDNSIVFHDSFCGVSFGPDIIALTNNCWDASGAMISAPVFVNSSVPWNAYDGPILFSGGTAVNDIRRVLLHEFGHVLGLDHPDLNGQAVPAIMNSRESDLDRLQPDDIVGLRAIYPQTPPCAGDCGGDGIVTVDDILALVNIALGNVQVVSCLSGDVNGDSQITVDEILVAVNSALNGCQQPTPSPTAPPGLSVSGTVLMPNGQVAQREPSWLEGFAAFGARAALALFGNVRPVGRNVSVSLTLLDALHPLEPEPPLTEGLTNDLGQYQLFLPNGFTADTCRLMVSVGASDNGTLTRTFVFSTDRSVDIDFASEAAVRLILSQVANRIDLCRYSTTDIGNLVTAIREAPGLAAGTNAQEVNDSAFTIASNDPTVQAALNAPLGGSAAALAGQGRGLPGLPR